MQGFPDPYSGLAQGLTNGVQAGTNIMQMVYQKAQAAHANDITALKTYADMAADGNLSDAMVEDAYNRLAKPSLSRLDPKTPAPEYEESGGRKIGKKIKGIIESDYDDAFKQKAIQSLLITAPEKVQATFKPYMDTLKEGIETNKREKLITGTPGRQAPPPFPQEAIGLTQYPLTGDIPGTLGLRDLSQGLSPLEQFKNEQLVRAGKSIDLPKVAKSVTGPEWDEKARQIGLALELHPGRVTSEEKAWLSAYKDQKIATVVERNKVFGSVPTAIPGVYYDRLKKQYVEDGAVLSSGEVRARGIDYKEDTSMAGQRGGSATANISAANELYQKNLPRLIELRNLVAKKGLLPETEFTDLNALSQWLDMKGSDPDMAELQGKVKLMADNLQKTIGGAQGGEWAFKVADTLLNPTLGPEAFQRRMESHGEDLSYLSTTRRNFGKTAPKGGKPIAKEPASGGVIRYNAQGQRIQ